MLPSPHTNSWPKLGRTCCNNQSDQPVSDLPAKVEFAKLSLKVLSSQPSWLTVNWVTFRAVTLPCLYPLLLVKSFLFSVLETMQGLFVCFGVVFPI